MVVSAGNVAGVANVLKASVYEHSGAAASAQPLESHHPLGTVEEEGSIGLKKHCGRDCAAYYRGVRFEDPFFVVIFSSGVGGGTLNKVALSGITWFIARRFWL